MELGSFKESLFRGAQPTEFNGIKFESRGEYFRYIKLLDMEKKGIIKDIKHHEPLILLGQNKNVSHVYESDFSYIYKDKKIYEEYKSSFSNWPDEITLLNRLTKSNSVLLGLSTYETIKSLSKSITINETRFEKYIQPFEKPDKLREKVLIEAKSKGAISHLETNIKLDIKGLNGELIANTGYLHYYEYKGFKVVEKITETLEELRDIRIWRGLLLDNFNIHIRQVTLRCPVNLYYDKYKERYLEKLKYYNNLR
jgi:hypothetical protein